MHVAVYGSLRRGEHADLSNNKHAKYIRDVEVPGTLYRVSWFPGVVNQNDGNTTKGELFEIDEKILDALDTYEGYDSERIDSSLFVRELVNFGDVDAYVYYYNHPSTLTQDQEVLGGDWKTA